jgi:hypothetical protein
MRAVHRHLLMTIRACIVSVVACQAGAAAPFELAGYVFSSGEQAFADDAFLASGTIRWWCVSAGLDPATSVSEALTGSDTDHCVNNNTGDTGIVEVLFLDNQILNDVGADLVIFEGSGTLPAGTPDERERFGVSVFDGSDFTEYQYFDPISFGADGLFTVALDLDLFGIAGGDTVDRVRLHIFDVGLGTKSADISALGALNSVPEPGTASLMALGLLILTRSARRSRCVRERASTISS